MKCDLSFEDVPYDIRSNGWIHGKRTDKKWLDRPLERVFRCCSVCETMEDYKQWYLMVWTNYMSPCSSIVGLYFKLAEHSFSARFCWCNLARAQGFQKTNMPPAERSFYLLNIRTICVIFLYNCMQCVDGFNILLQQYVTKGNDVKNPAIFSFCLLPKEPS